MGQRAKSCFLATLASRLRLDQSGTRVDGDVQTRVFKGFGLKIRERKTVTSPDDLYPDGMADATPRRIRSEFSLDAFAHSSTNGTSHGFSEMGEADDAGNELAVAIAAQPSYVAEEIETLPPGLGRDLSALARATYAQQESDALDPEPGHQPSAVDPGFPLEVTRESATVSATQPLAPPTPASRYAVLSGKVIGVVGFPAERAVSIGQSLAAQHCSFVILSQAEAEFHQGAAGACHLLWIAAAEDWSNPASLKVNWLAKLKKAALVESDRTTLSFLARLPQGAQREFVPGPCSVDELLWRSTLILGRVPASKPGKRRKRRHPKLLIADSDAAALTLIETVLSQEGVECQVADQGLLALELIKATQPDAVILEVTLPGVDGFQLLAEIRRDPALADMVVILLTFQQAEADVLRGFSLGADDYVTKPFSPLELAARLKRALARRS